MRRFATVLTVIFASAFSSSCGGPQRYVNPSREILYHVPVWVNPESGLSAADVMAGCEAWREKGVRCVRAATPSEATVIVESDGGACVPGESGRRTLAWASPEGVVTFRTACFLNDGLSYDRHMFQAVAAHEFGHSIGIWEHVPESCGGKPQTHPSGVRVCGTAVMNPYYDEDVHFLTPIDSLAFDVRDTAHSSLMDVDDSSSPRSFTGCVYRSR